MADNREGKSVLTLKNVTKRFSGLVAVNDLSLDMKERTIHALIGPNGAGKSTAINMITGLLPLTEGEIYHEGTKISGMSAHQIVSAGFAGVRSEVLLHALEEKGIYVSSGSACSSNHPAISGTLKAIGVKKELLDSTLRFSFGLFNTKEEIDYCMEALEGLLPVLRKYHRG